MSVSFNISAVRGAIHHVGAQDEQKRKRILTTPSNKIDHYANVCRSGRRRIANGASQYGQSSRSAYSQRGGNQNSNQVWRRPEINQLSHEVGEQVVNSEEYAEFLRYKQAANYGVFAVSNDGDR